MVTQYEENILAQACCETNRTWCVYMHVNKVNGKKYIGQTSQTPPEKRWNNGWGYVRCVKFWRAIQKYGWDNFEHIIVQDGLTLYEANCLEEKLIAEYNTLSDDFGYNLQSGGLNKLQSEETKNKVSEHHADFNSGKHPRARAVYCIELNKIFECMRDAQRELNINVKDISGCCRERRNTAGGYHWIYADKIDETYIEKVLMRKRRAQITNVKRVRCKETGEIFDSMTQAARQKGVDLSSISACCRGKLTHTKGLHWELVEDSQ